MDGIAFSFLLIYNMKIYYDRKSTIYHTVHVSPNTYIIGTLGPYSTLQEFLITLYMYITLHVHVCTMSCILYWFNKYHC